MLRRLTKPLQLHYQKHQSTHTRTTCSSPLLLCSDKKRINLLGTELSYTVPLDVPCDSTITGEQHG